MTGKPPRNPLENLEQNDFVGCPRAKRGVFTDEECERIIALSDGMPLVDGQVNSRSDATLNAAIRHSSVKWLLSGPDSMWVFDRIRDVANEANRFYKYELRGFNGSQIAQYGVGGHYTWHMDLGSGENSLRKLSISIQLTAPEDYEGGDLEFNTVEDSMLMNNRQRGTAIFFPSFMDHRVTPVTQGTRWSLVTWVYGPSFR